MHVPVLNLAGFSVLRRGEVVCGPLSMRVGRGDVVVLRGENGSGKSTLLEAVVGVHREYSGVRLLFAKTWSLKPQSPVLFPSLSLGELLRLSARGPCRSSAMSLAVKLGISHLSDHPLGVLSAGEAQKAAFVAVASSCADLVLLDEPLAGLDGESAGLLWREILSMSCRAGVIVADHNQECEGATTELRLD